MKLVGLRGFVVNGWLCCHAVHWLCGLAVGRHGQQAVDGIYFLLSQILSDPIHTQQKTAEYVALCTPKLMSKVVDGGDLHL